MKNDPVLLPPDLRDHPLRPLPTRLAAAYLGVHPHQLRILQAEGQIPRIKLGFKHMYLLKDLDEFLLTRRGRWTRNRIPWDKDSDELPTEAIAKLAGATCNAIKLALSQGVLKDRTYKSVRAYMFRRMQRRIGMILRAAIKDFNEGCSTTE